MELARLVRRVKKARLWNQEALLAELRKLALSLAENVRPPKTCPICLATFADFTPFRNRPHARCPKCGSFERHRLSWLYLKSETGLFREPTRLLHIAPEEVLRDRIRSNLHVTYTSASYDPSKPEPGIDIQALPYGDESFDMVYCSHVLEHIPDDRLAMRELARVLRSGGRAVIMVPVRNVANTYEDASITSPEERTKHFGRFDHLRWYGRDLVTRLSEAGFEVKIVYHNDALSIDEQVRFGVYPEPIFDCRKP